MSFAGWMIEDQSADVQRIYLLIEIILSNFIYLAEISLLLTIWCLLSYCAMKPQHGSAKPYRMLGRFHLLFACVLLGLWVGIMYSSIDYRLQRIRYNVTRYDAYSGLYNRSRRTWRDLNVAYTALYLVASIETVALTVINYVQSRGQNNEGSVSSFHIHQHTQHLPNFPQIHILTLALVSGPLLIRSLFLTGVVGAGFARIIDSKAQLACSIIIQVCFVIIYAGIIVVVTHLDRVRYPPPTGGPPLPTQQRGPPLPPMTEQKYPQANTSTLPPNPQVGMNAPSNGTHHSLPTVSSWTPTNDLNAQPNGTAWPVQNHHPAGYAPVPQQQPPSDSTSPPPAQWTRFS